MHFCSVCENMYYLRISDEDSNKLIYYCRHCGNTADNITDDDVCVLKTQVKRSEEKSAHVVNEYTKEDPTIPRINTIRCPNQECSSNKKDGEREVLYIRYDDSNMKYIYMCAKCDCIWKTSEKH